MNGNGSDLALRVMHVEARQIAEGNRITDLMAKHANTRVLIEKIHDNATDIRGMLCDVLVRLQAIDDKLATKKPKARK